MKRSTRALWKLTWLESRLLWCALAVLVFGFHWIHTWVVSQFEAKQLGQMIDALPDVLKKLIPVEVHQAVRTEGRLAFAYDHGVSCHLAGFVKDG